MASQDGKGSPAGAYTLGVDQIPVRESGQSEKVILSQDILQRRRWGGGVNPDEPYLVGEAGPEIMVPMGRGDIFNTGQYVNAMSGMNAITGAGGGGANGGFFNQSNTNVGGTTIIHQSAPPQPHFGMRLAGDVNAA